MTAPREPSALERLRALDRPEPGTSGGPSRPAPSARRRGVVGSVFAALLLALGKGKALLLLLATKGGLLLSALKLGKLATTFATMGATVLLYATLWPVSFSVGVVLLILVHELGHGLAAMRLGLRVGAPVFIPGFGAWIALKDQPRSTWVNAVVGYGGPLAGTLGGLLVLVAGPLVLPSTSPAFWSALAHLTFVMNLFNLIPVFGLDGDRITEPLRTGHWIAGLAATVAVAGLSMSEDVPEGTAASLPSIFALAIVALGAIKAFVEQRRRRVAATAGGGRLVDRVIEPVGRYAEEASVEPRQRTLAALAYFGLVAALVALATAAVPTLSPPR